MGTPIRVLVVLETADESSIPLEVAGGVADASPDIDQTVCSFQPPATETFGLDVVGLGGTTRLDPRSYRRLDSLLRDADVVHIHPNATGAVARVLAAHRGVPAVKTEHNTHSDYGRLKNLLNGTANCLSDVVVAVSESLAADFRPWERALLRAAGTRTRVIRHGVDAAAIRRAAEQVPPVTLPDGVLVGAGGRFVPQKNLETLLEAVGTLVDDHPALHLVLTGDGPLRQDLTERVAELGLQRHVTFTGYLPRRSDVHAVLGRLDLYAIPSLHEGFGVAALEAMAAGLPVVASDIPPLREVVDEGGTFVDPQDTAGIAAAIGRLVGDASRRDRLAERARQRAASFSLEWTVEQHLQLYRRLAE
jgi:glycosyltransferase involved in cell wall biosynthesis